jgi:hypothetical protein
MSVFETVQEQLLEALIAGEDAVVSGVKSLVERTQPITAKLPDVPFADRLPDPADVADNAFSFAEKLLATQKAFAVKLAGAYGPATATRKPAARRSTKPATKPATKSTRKPAARAATKAS